jgi:hypothetical protein
MVFFPEIYIKKNHIAGAKKWPRHAEISWTYYLGKGFRPLHVPSRPSKVVQNRICIGIDEMAYER